jgi:hypothetical protein
MFRNCQGISGHLDISMPKQFPEVSATNPDDIND